MTTQPQHTPEPWHVVEASYHDEFNSPAYGIVDAEENEVGITSWFDPGKADAKRIVTAVNAMAGITLVSDALGTVRALIVAARDAVETASDYTREQAHSTACVRLRDALAAFEVQS